MMSKRRASVDREELTQLIELEYPLAGVLGWAGGAHRLFYRTGARVGVTQWCKISELEAHMCSNFGLNLHPDRTQGALEFHWYFVFLRLSDYLRRKFHSIPQPEDSLRRPQQKSRP